MSRESISVDIDTDSIDESTEVRFTDWGDFLNMDIFKTDPLVGGKGVSVETYLIDGEDLPALADFMSRAAHGWRKP